MPTLAESLRATLSQWTQPESEPAPEPTAELPQPPALAPPSLTASPDPVISLLNLPLSLLRTDPHQPRHYLPDDLRGLLQTEQAGAADVLRALTNRAAHGDVEAQGYLADLRELADSIASVGLQQPLRVSQEPTRDGSTIFRIVDGERRFLAMTLLDLDAPAGADREVSAILHNPAASAEDIQRAQWAANLCRRDVPAIDIAHAVWRIRDDYFARLAVDPARYTETLGDEVRNRGLSLNDMAVGLTQAEVAKLTGRNWSERTLYAYLALAEKIKPRAVELARAYNLSQRQLQGLSNLNEDEQVRLLLRMVGKPEPPREGMPTNSSARAGRPTALLRGINACVSLATVLQQLSPRNLARTTAEDRQSLLAELDHAAAQIEAARRLLHSQVNK